MRFGDLLEWLAAAALVAAAYLLGAKFLSDGLPIALLAAAIALGYFAQCYDQTKVRVPWRRPPK